MNGRRKTISWGEKKGYHCSGCGITGFFCWKCPCGFQICNRCMGENFWGMSCSGAQWRCPDCGSFRSF